MAVEVHSAQASPTTYANLVESHNDYVQQLHAANGMVDQVSPSFKLLSKTYFLQFTHPIKTIQIYVDSIFLYRTRKMEST